MNSKIKEQLRQRIKSLDVLTNEERSQLLELLAENKPYGLVWEDKPEDVEERLRDELPVLKEVPERAIISDNPDAPNHILIEGDNLEALTALAYTHGSPVQYGQQGLRIQRPLCGQRGLLSSLQVAVVHEPKIEDCQAVAF